MLIDNEPETLSEFDSTKNYPENIKLYEGYRERLGTNHAAIKKLETHWKEKIRGKLPPDLTQTWDVLMIEMKKNTNYPQT